MVLVSRYLKSLASSFIDIGKGMFAAAAHDISVQETFLKSILVFLIINRSWPFFIARDIIL
jgi:hypothetical protein